MVAADGKLYLGVVDEFGTVSRLVILDAVALSQVDLRGTGSMILGNIEDYILDTYLGVGTSPALASGSLYTSGSDGEGPFLLGLLVEQERVIPEPATAALLAAGCLGLRRLRRKRSAASRCASGG
jgi:hypothetical protein